MPKERKGYTFQEGKVWIARLTYTDERGVRRNVKRRAQTAELAAKQLEKIKRKIEHSERGFEAERMTFAQLADYYQERYLIAPVYVDGRKAAGLRSYKDGLRRLAVLRLYFAKRKIAKLTYGDIEKFKTDRLNVPTKTGGQRMLATIHRELALLRSMLRVALREGWIARSPFDGWKPLITTADERKRERILTREEEARLLAACEGTRAHLKPILLAALDTGMRRGELFKLEWRDVDFKTRTITVRAFNTKTMRERKIMTTTRLQIALEELYANAPSDLYGRVFGITDNVSRSFTAVRRVAGLEDFRFHDARHTAATRLVRGHLPLAEVGRILGHTTPATTYRYVNADQETAERAAAVLDAFNIAPIQIFASETEASETIN